MVLGGLLFQKDVQHCLWIDSMFRKAPLLLFTSDSGCISRHIHRPGFLSGLHPNMNLTNPTINTSSTGTYIKR